MKRGERKDVTKRFYAQFVFLASEKGKYFATSLLLLALEMRGEECSRVKNNLYCQKNYAS
jgi:hypothetical protein